MAMSAPSSYAIRPPSISAWLSFALLGCLMLVGCGQTPMLVGNPTVVVEELKARLESAAPPVVVDVRAPADYAAGHIRGAWSLPLDALTQRKLPVQGLPLGTRGIVTVCYKGDAGALAISYLRGFGPNLPNEPEHVASLVGGMETWVAAGLPVETDSSPADSTLSPAPLRKLQPFTEWVAFITGAFLKPAYMLLSLGVILWLRKSKARDLQLICWGLVTFLTGETLCAVDFYLHRPGLFYPIEWGHGVGMVGGAALVLWGIFELVDSRLTHLLAPDQTCVFNRFCKHCHKREAVPCRPEAVFRRSLLLVAPISLLPWTSSMVVTPMVAKVFGTPVDYGQPILNQLLELRLYPTLGSALVLLAWGMSRKSHGWTVAARGALFFGLGFLMFSLFRWTLVTAFQTEPYWGEFWEELTELLTVVLLMVILGGLRVPLGLSGAATAPLERQAQ